MTLAIHGGKPVRSKQFPPVYTINNKEINAVVKLMKTGPLSGYVAEWGDAFYGGASVQELEKQFAKKFKVKYAVSYNSASTAIAGALAACKVGPGDEVIVPPYTMSATATAVILNGAVPIFADISENNLCIDPVSVLKKINSRTKAIIAVNLFGFTADLTALKNIAKNHNLFLIEDNAQSAGAKYRGKFSGTIGDIGIFSLNVHKVIQSGEGGILVTNDKKLALRAQLVRNHGEVVVDQMENYNLGPIVGSNYRLNEIAAVISTEQLKKLHFLNTWRIKLATRLAVRLNNIEGINLFKATQNSRLAYYLFPFRYNEEKVGVPRAVFVQALKAEGFPVTGGYVKPIYLLPLYKQKRAFNNTNFPFDYKRNLKMTSYQMGDCPVCEKMYFKELILTPICQYPYTLKDVDQFAQAVVKVLDHKEQLL